MEKNSTNAKDTDLHFNQNHAIEKANNKVKSNKTKKLYSISIDAFNDDNVIAAFKYIENAILVKEELIMKHNFTDGDFSEIYKKMQKQNREIPLHYLRLD